MFPIPGQFRYYPWKKFENETWSGVPNSILDTDDAVRVLGPPLHLARPPPSLTHISSAPWDQSKPAYSHTIVVNTAYCNDVILSDSYFRGEVQCISWHVTWNTFPAAVELRQFAEKPDIRSESFQHDDASPDHDRNRKHGGDVKWPYSSRQTASTERYRSQLQLQLMGLVKLLAF